MRLKNIQFPVFLSYSLLICFSLFSAIAIADDHNRKKTVDKAIDKVKGSLSVMVLGSGGPAVTADGRASAGYLIFTDGTPRILMDAGGGTHKNFVSSGANIKDLDIILLTHLHIDHMGDLSPIVKAMYFQNRAYNLENKIIDPDKWRKDPIRIFGPGANGAKFPPALGDEAAAIDQYPSSKDFVDSHYDLKSGNERYLHVFTGAISAGKFNFETTNVSPKWIAYEPETIIDEDGLVVKAVGVNHGPVPALAFRIEYKGKSIVYSGDTSSRSTDPDGNPLPNGGNMVSISENADLLIYDTAIMERGDAPNGPNDNVFFALHTTPSRIGEVATAANVKKVVLSHITAVTQNRIDEVKKLIRAQGFIGKISESEDLKVYNVGMHGHH